jgi:hypothetical protein
MQKTFWGVKLQKELIPLLRNTLTKVKPWEQHTQCK